MLNSRWGRATMVGDFLLMGKEVNNVKKCYRCGGTMVFEKFYGVCEQFSGWRCIFCGEIIDPVIFENRLSQKN